VIDRSRDRTSVIGRMSVHQRSDADAAPPIGAVLANGLRRLMGRGQYNCRLRRVAPTVQLKKYERFVDGRTRSKVVVDGVATCKSRLCPMCVGKWERTRANEITQAVENWGSFRTLFATFTQSHRRDMPLVLLHRMQRHAYGAMWSGRRGQAAARRLGGRPESVRSHDLTWSAENGFHPHLHCLLFLQDRCDNLEDMHRVLDRRWRESLVATLRSFKHLLFRIQLRVTCRVEWRRVDGRLRRFVDCEHCRRGGDGQCPVWRERAVKMFSSKLFRAKNRDGSATTLIGEAQRVTRMLRNFTEANIQPSVARGVKLEQVRDEKGMGTYLAKLGAMGFELASASTKRAPVPGADAWGLGHLGSDKRVRHYGLWELGRLCTIHGHPLRVVARRAWRDLFTATRGTQTITFSNREELGLGPDEYPDEPEVPNPEPEQLSLGDGEFSSVLGTIAAGTWDHMARTQGHGLLVMIEHAHQLGLLERLPQVDPPIHFMAGTPSNRGPPERAPPPPTTAERDRAEREALERGQAFWSSVTAQLRARDVPHDWLFMEEVREQLWKANAATDMGSHVPRVFLPRETYAETYRRDQSEQESRREPKV